MYSEELIKAENISKTFYLSRGICRKQCIHAVCNAEFSVNTGETVALIGESGSGKSTIGKIILGLLEPTAGRILFKGRELGDLKGKDYQEYRKALQAVFQDPHSSLNPRMTIGETIIEPLRNFGHLGGYRSRAEELLRVVGLNGEFIDRYPHQCSGGQKQRIALARALAAEPALIVLDEPLSALDVTTQAHIISLLNKLKTDKGLSFLLITHDLRAARKMAERVIVMHRGKIIDQALTKEFFDNPGNSYSESLINAIPGL